MPQLPTSLRPSSRLLRGAAWAAAGLVVLLVVLWLALPPLLRWQAQEQLSALLGRTVTVGAVEVRPWALEATVRDLQVAAAASAPASAPPTFRFERLRANVSAASVFRLAPVVEALELDAPVLHVARTAPGRYDVDDILAKLAPAEPKPQEPAAEPFRFALYNVALRGGAVRFDDRPAGRVHQLEALQLTLPFLSDLPAQVDITVEPRVAFTLNGAPFDSGAQALPFAQTRRGDLRLTVDRLDLAPYLAYLPAGLPVRPVRGVLAGDFALQFVQPPSERPRVELKGRLEARDIGVQTAAGAPLLAWKSLQLELADLQPLARRLAFGTLRVDGAELDLARDAGGRLNVQPAATPTPAAAAKPASAPASSAPGPAAAPAPGWQISLAAVALNGARLRWNDAAVRPAAALLLDDVALTMKNLRWPVEAPAPLTLEATLKPQADGAAAAGTLRVAGEASDRLARLDLSLQSLSLPALAPYLAQALSARVDGALGARGRLDWAAGAGRPDGLRLVLASATLDGLAIQPVAAAASAPAAGLRAAPPPSADRNQPADGATLKRVELADATIDLGARRAQLGRLTLMQPTLGVWRDTHGEWNVMRWLAAASAPRPAAVPTAAPPAAPSTAASPPARAARASRMPAPAPAPAAAAAPPWDLQLASLVIDGGALSLRDDGIPGRAGRRGARVDVSALKLAVQDFRWHGDRPQPAAKLQLSARVAEPARRRDVTPPRPGSLNWNGSLALLPVLAAQGRLELVRMPLHAFEPWAEAALPLRLLHADGGWKGSLALKLPAAGPEVRAEGDVLLGDVHLATRGDTRDGVVLGEKIDELLSWQSLALTALRFEMKPGAKPALSVGATTLTDLYASLVVTEQGRFNLQDVRAPSPADAAASGPAAAAAAPAAPAASAAAAADDGLPIVITLGPTTLRNGRIDFADRFVQPNYSAELTQLEGEIGPLSSTSRTMATIALRGRAAGTALLQIDGALNPTVKPLALDIRAKATDLELPPLSPYAGKYAGYAIERGKLSVDVAYKIEPDGRLEARNQLVLNQLTFGDRIESPSATKLPVLLAVALLKDRHGVIDIDLPIRGSLNDPQFSVGGVVVKLIVNLLVKALTSPFTLLAGLGGDGGGDPGTVVFLPGTARLDPASGATLEKVAKALGDRPALKMTVNGLADPATEREAYQRAVVEARLAAEARRDALRGGAAPAAAAAASAPPPLTAEERSRLLRTLYRRTEIAERPRNALGLLKDIPEPEMEAILRRAVPVDDNTMRELAIQRGLAVRDALIAKGLANDRLFLGAPQVGKPPAKDGEAAPAAGGGGAKLVLRAD